MSEKIDKWFADFEWGDEKDLWRQANENGAKVLLDYLLKDADRFVTVETNPKTGDFAISILWGPMELEIKRKDMDEDKEYFDRGSTKRFFSVFAKPAKFTET